MEGNDTKQMSFGRTVIFNISRGKSVYIITQNTRKVRVKMFSLNVLTDHKIAFRVAPISWCARSINVTYIIYNIFNLNIHTSK